MTASERINCRRRDVTLARVLLAIVKRPSRKQSIPGTEYRFSRFVSAAAAITSFFVPARPSLPPPSPSSLPNPKQRGLGGYEGKKRLHSSNFTIHPYRRVLGNDTHLVRYMRLLQDNRFADYIRFYPLWHIIIAKYRFKPEVHLDEHWFCFWTLI